MTAALNKNFMRMGGKRDASQGQSARKKMTAAEWGNSYSSCAIFISSREIAGPS
jgi:hypothetical protein